jgi:hypothetical protein
MLTRVICTLVLCASKQTSKQTSVSCLIGLSMTCCHLVHATFFGADSLVHVLLLLQTLRLAAGFCSFFVVQLSSMITGWVAISALSGPLPKGTSVFSAVLTKVAAEGVGQTVLAALLLASGAQRIRT